MFGMQEILGEGVDWGLHKIHCRCLVSKTATSAFRSENLLRTVTSIAAKYICPCTKRSG